MITPETTISDGGRYVVPGCKGAVEQCSFTNSGGTAHGRGEPDESAHGVERRLLLHARRSVLDTAQHVRRPDPRHGQGPRVRRRERHSAARRTERVRAHAGREAGLARSEPDGLPLRRLFTGDNVQLAIGQNAVAVTPLQLANAYSTLANGGTLYSPNIAVKITKGGTNEIVRTIEARALHQVSMPPEFRDPIMQGLFGAVNSGEGTAYGAFPVVPELAGGRQDRHGPGHGQAGHRPLRRHCTVRCSQVRRGGVLEQSGFGATAAAPVIRRVFQRSPTRRRRRPSGPAVCCRRRCRVRSTTPTEVPTDGRDDPALAAAQPDHDAAPQPERGVAPSRPGAGRLYRRRVLSRRVDGVLRDPRDLCRPIR